MNINEIRREFEKFGWQVMDYHMEETFQLRKHGSADNNETIYNLTELEEKLFEMQDRVEDDKRLFSQEW